MVHCCVPYCKSHTGNAPDVSIHKFPSNAELYAEWENKISRDNHIINDKSAFTVVCSRHFHYEVCLLAASLNFFQTLWLFSSSTIIPT